MKCSLDFYRFSVSRFNVFQSVTNPDRSKDVELFIVKYDNEISFEFLFLR